MKTTIQQVDKPLIFVHLPKTGGTSMRILLSTQTKTDFISLSNKLNKFKEQYTEYYDQDTFINKHFLHIHSTEMWEYWINSVEDKSMNEIIELHFDVVDMDPIPNDLYKNNLYKNFNWMTMLRDPVERVISEYFFFRKNINKNDFILWRCNPHIDIGNDVIEYAKKDLSKNCMTKWLLGNGYLTNYQVTEDDVTTVIDIIESLDFKVGILERLNDSIDYWNKSFKFNLRYEDMGQRRVNNNKPIVEERVREIIKENNKWDIKLYNYYLDKLGIILGE